MARTRQIKPEFFTSEQIAELDRDTRLLFIGMWTHCDDSGIHPAGLRLLKMQVFPGDNLSTEEIGLMIDKLLDKKLLDAYVVNDRPYWIVTGWHRHQRIDKPTFKFPLPDGTIPTLLSESSNPTRRTVKETPKMLPAPDKIIAPATVKVGEAVAVVVKDGVRKTAPAKALVNGEPPTFQEFYDLYPKTNCSRKEALKSYTRALTKGVSHAEIISGTREYIAYIAASGSPVAHASTWLNNERWTVDYNAAIAARNLVRPQSPHDKLGEAWRGIVADNSPIEN